MIVEKCPKCGRMPVIIELPVNPKFKNGIRRRLCKCPRYHSVIPRNGLNDFYFEFDGEGDANAIYRKWNKYIDRYIENSNKPYYERDWSKIE